MNFPKLCFSMMQLLFLRKEREFVSRLNDLQRHLGSLSVLKRHGKFFTPQSCWCSITRWGRGYRRPTPHVYDEDVCSCVAALWKDWPVHVTHREASTQAETVQELHCRLWDSTFILKLVESSTVHLLRLYEREIICPRVDSTVFTLSCWEGWCAQLTLLWKVKVILGSLHFANSGE